MIGPADAGDADFVAKAMTGRANRIAPCIACNQACLDHKFSGKLTSFLVNPRACHETELTIGKADAAKTIVVVGAGPAGLSATLTAAERGHSVTMFDKASEIGGQLNMAKQVSDKEEFWELVDWYRQMVADAGIAVELNRAVQADDFTGFDEAIIATGVTPRDPGIPGKMATMFSAISMFCAKKPKPASAWQSSTLVASDLMSRNTSSMKAKARRKACLSE